MTETLQLKYLLNKYTLEIERESVIDVVRLTSPAKYNFFQDIYDNSTRKALETSADNSLIVTSVTTAALKEQMQWSGGIYQRSFEKARFREDANGKAYGWGSRKFTQETWGIANDNHLSLYSEGILFEQQFDNTLVYDNFSTIGSMFLPTLIGRTENGLLYDILSDYTSKSQFTYNPVSQPVYMKKRLVATFIGIDKDGKYKIAWQDVSNNPTASSEKISLAAKMPTVTNTYLSEYYTPTIVYDTNAFTTSNSPKLNRSDKSVSEALYTLTLNLPGLDLVRGNDTFKFLRKAQLMDALKYAKGFWHTSDVIGLGNYYLPFAMYLNQVDWAKVQGLKVGDTQYSQSSRISDNFTAKTSDPIKLIGVADDTGKLAGVKLGLDATALIDDNSLMAVKTPSATVNELSEAGVSKLKVNKEWVENIVENKIVNGPRLEYPIGGFILEKDLANLYQTNIVVYRSSLSDSFNYSSDQKVYEKSPTIASIFSRFGELKDKEEISVNSLVQCVWPDQSYNCVLDQDSEDSENTSESEQGTSDNPGSTGPTKKPGLNGSLYGAYTGIEGEKQALFEVTKDKSNVVTTLVEKQTGDVAPLVTVPKRLNLTPSKRVIIGGLQEKNLYIGNEKYFATKDISTFTRALALSTAEAISTKNIDLGNIIKVNGALVSSIYDKTKTYMPNWGLGHLKANVKKFGKVASVLYNNNTVAITTENTEIKTLEKDPVNIALVSQRPQIVTSLIRGYRLGTKESSDILVENTNNTFIKANSKRTSGVLTSTFGNITLRTGQTGIGYIGRLNNKLITEEIHNGASIELDKQNININTISNYDILVTDPDVIYNDTKTDLNKSIILPKSSSKQNGSVYVKSAGFTSEIYDKYAESASAAIRFTSSAARICEIYNNEQTSLGIHNSNLGQIKQTTFERIQLSTTENLSDTDSTVLETKVNITAGGYRFRQGNITTNVPDRIVYKSCSLELTQDDVFVTIGKTMYSMTNLFNALKLTLGTFFDQVIVSKTRGIMSGNRPLSGFDSTTGLSSDVAQVYAGSQKIESEETEIIWYTTTSSTNLNALVGELGFNEPTTGVTIQDGTSVSIQADKFTPDLNKKRLINLGTSIIKLGNTKWSTEAPKYKYKSTPDTVYSWPAVRSIGLQRNKNGILTISTATPFVISKDTAYTGYTTLPFSGNDTFVGSLSVRNDSEIF